MTGRRALGAAAVGDAGVRDLASEYPGPRTDARPGAGRGRGAGSRADERMRRVQPERRDG